jgi:hypothetical protein
MDASLTLSQVELFRDLDASRELGPAIQAAFREVENFYNRAGARLQCSRFRILSKHVTTAFSTVAREKPSLDEAPKVDPDSEPTALEVRGDLWDSVRGRYSKTVDHEKLGEVVTLALRTNNKPNHVLIVTDQELTPPPKWRYVIWHYDGTIASISLAPLDPRYWGESADSLPPSRVGIIKQRIRVAGLSIVGAWLGLQRCEHPGCFMFGPIDSFVQLDDMDHLSAEHVSEAPWLQNVFGLSFPAVSECPDRVESMRIGSPHRGSSYV